MSHLYTCKLVLESAFEHRCHYPRPQIAMFVLQVKIKIYDEY
jgi:hypothetical protein